MAPRSDTRQSGTHQSGTEELDATIRIATPENIAFQYQLAGPFRRLPAFLIDLAIRMGVLFLMAMVVGMLGLLGPNVASPIWMVFIIIYFGLEWFYGTLFEALWNGQTPGKWLLGLRVLTTSGQPINGLQAVVRNLFRLLDLMPPLPLAAFIAGAPIVATLPTGLVGLMSCLMSPRYQRLGDWLSDTIVVIEEKAWLPGTVKLEDQRAAQLATYIPPTFVVNRTLAQALATYVERRPYFSLARRREIAKHLAEPLVAKFGFPADTGYDLLLCALYHRTFIEAQPGEVGGDHRAFGSQPQAYGSIQPPQAEGIYFVK